MRQEDLKLNPNRLVQFLQKPMREFTKADILKVIEEFEIEMIKFRYMANDGRLKTLNFVINSMEHADEILTSGERVDGSSLFPFLEAGSSDLYVIPRFRTAFIDPFADIPTLDILCNFYTKDGEPFDMAPEYTLAKAGKAFREATGGMEFEVMGELEYYVIAPKEEQYMTADQRGYHASTPFCKFENFRTEAMKLIAECGGLIKYGHSEVGNFSVDDLMYEQNEIEFLPTTLEDAADQLVIAKWIMRTLGYQYGITVTFAPKITVGKAGSGMHIHTRITKDGKMMYIGENGLTEVAHKAIAGLLDLAGTLTHQHLLGRPQPQRHGARSAGLDQRQRQHDGALQPAGEGRGRGFLLQTDHRAAHSRRQRQCLSAAGRHDRGRPSRFRDGERRAVCQGPLCEREHL